MITQKQIDARKTSYVVEVVFCKKGKTYTTCVVLSNISSKQVTHVHNSKDDKAIDYEILPRKDILYLEQVKKLRIYKPKSVKWNLADASK